MKIKIKTISILCAVPFIIMTITALTRLTLIYREEAGRTGVTVLMYHGTVENRSDEDRYNIGIGRLDAHLQALKNSGYRIITDRDIITAATDQSSLPEKSLLLTFDDGSSDHYSRVLPLLLKHDIKAVFFIISDRTGRPGTLTEKELKAMSDWGMSIQSHSASAESLLKLDSESRIQNIRSAIMQLKKITGTDITSLSLPGGQYNQAVLADARQAGYQLVFSSDASRTEINKDTFLLGRIEVRGGTSADALLKSITPSGIAKRRFIQDIKKILK